MRGPALVVSLAVLFLVCALGTGVVGGDSTGAEPEPSVLCSDLSVADERIDVYHQEATDLLLEPTTITVGAPVDGGETMDFVIGELVTDRACVFFGGEHPGVGISLEDPTLSDVRIEGSTTTIAFEEGRTDGELTVYVTFGSALRLLPDLVSGGVSTHDQDATGGVDQDATGGVDQDATGGVDQDPRVHRAGAHVTGSAESPTDDPPRMAGEQQILFDVTSSTDHYAAQDVRRYP